MGNNRQIRITYSSHTHPTLTTHAPKTTYPPAQLATKPPTPTRLRAQKPFITLTISSCSRQQYNLNFQVWSYMEYCTYGPSSSIVEMGSAADRLIVVINGKMNVYIEGCADKEGTASMKTLQVMVCACEEDRSVCVCVCVCAFSDIWETV